MKALESRLKQMQVQLAATLKRLPRELAEIAVGESMSNFRRESFDGVKWPARKLQLERNKGRGLLIDKGRLRRSIRIISVSRNSFTLGSDVPYAQIQNEGGQIAITPKMRKFFWAKFYEASESIEARKDGSVSLNSTNKAIGAEAMGWRGLALKRGPLKIPKRQFIGATSSLYNRMEKYFVAQVSKALLS